MKKLKFDLHTGAAFIIWAALIATAFYIKGDSPGFGTFCMWLTLGLTGYTGKRLFQKKPEFNSVK